MKALGYLLRTILKNKIFSLRKKPALLIMYIIVAVSIIGMLVAYSMDGGTSGTKSQSFADIRVLYAILAGVGLLFVYSLIMTGLSTGSTIFNMADVGLLFVAPVSSKKILIYGLIKQMGTTIITAVFILFQIGTIKNSFGLNGIVVFYIFVIYAIILFYCQLLSIAVYIFTNGNPNRKNLVKGILYGGMAAIVLAVAFIHMKNGGSIFQNLLSLFDMKPFYFIPVLGWSAMFLKAVIEGSVVYVIVSLVLFAVTGTAMVLLFTRGDADYYEDVLSSTELNYNRLQDAKEGKRVVNTSKVKVKEKETGIRKGKGYNTIFYKHLLEKRRTSRFLFLDFYTVGATLGAAIFCKYMNKDFSVYFVLCILVYFQFFMTILGKLGMELSKPYIYLIPEKSVKKVLAASATSLIKPCMDGIFIFTAACIFSKTSPLLNLFLALAYASSGAIFVSYTVLCQRVFGGQPNKLISAMLGMTLFLLVMAPGIGASAAAIAFLPNQLTFLGTLPFTFCCVVITILVFAVCGDLLDKAEYTGK